jgi:hypothetical protein
MEKDVHSPFASKMILTETPQLVQGFIIITGCKMCSQQKK